VTFVTEPDNAVCGVCCKLLHRCYCRTASLGSVQYVVDNFLDMVGFFFFLDMVGFLGARGVIFLVSIGQ
jgi:hypothetical protein